jgi:ABC-type transport system involved in cytochrome c biogenesis ATPase subunit
MKQPSMVNRLLGDKSMQLEMDSVEKVYRGGKRAVSGISMKVGPGVLGLLGPNGAGKSSLMRIVATITRPTGGCVTWNGTDIVKRPEELRRTLGYLPQDFGVYPNLTAPEFLSYLAAVKGLSARSARPRIDELLELVNLNEVRRRPMGKYSGGMRQRVGIAQALLARRLGPGSPQPARGRMAGRTLPNRLRRLRAAGEDGRGNRLGGRRGLVRRPPVHPLARARAGSSRTEQQVVPGRLPAALVCGRELHRNPRLHGRGARERPTSGAKPIRSSRSWRDPARGGPGGPGGPPCPEVTETSREHAKQATLIGSCCDSPHLGDVAVGRHR